MRLGTIVLVVWHSLPSCAGAGTVIVTILAGPLNYAGINPRVSCHS
jgi:hypothetical protein